jgi:hypothetical protein
MRKQIYFKPYKRNCPNCHRELEYTDRANIARAIKRNCLCASCAGDKKNTEEVKAKISKALTGRKYFNRKSNTKEGKIFLYFRDCPSCKKEMGYTTKYGRDRANKSASICNKCSNLIHKKAWKYVIKDEHVKQMTATKAGYNTYQEYLDDFDRKKQYYREVRKVTKKQPIHTLENFDKLRTLCGIEGGYQLDHIISVNTGFDQNISPEKIGDISNLQIIPWKDNLLKSNNL